MKFRIFSATSLPPAKSGISLDFPHAKTPRDSNRVVRLRFVRGLKKLLFRSLSLSRARAHTRTHTRTHTHVHVP